MLSSEKEFLFLFGWDEFFDKHVSALDSQNLFPARVICEERNLYRVQAGLNFAFWASISGKMQYSATARVDYPAVGDWVMVELSSASDRGIIHQVLARKTIIYRKQIGSSADIQILSTNVDTMFITTSLNEDLNHRRIERYLAIAWESGSRPVILLTKADICSDKVDSLTLDVQANFPGVAVHALAKNDFKSASFLPEYLKKGTTSVFVGSSGVGKSTLVNFLISSEESEGPIRTQDIREDDGKGRHTTTSRSLYVSRYDGLVIDTPGMRELQLSDHAEGLSSQFSDIESLMQECRFTDCQHETEPGCAIKAALADDTLAIERWRGYQKLEAEIRYGLRKHDKMLAAQDRKAWKKISVEAQERSRFKKKGFK